jgi:uncharacterized Zn finger protein
MVKKCPNCKSENVTLYLGGKMGMYKCMNCGYAGALIIEEDDTEQAPRAFAKRKDGKRK